MPCGTCQGADTSREERVPQNGAVPALPEPLSVHQAPTGPRGKSATNTPVSAQQGKAGLGCDVFNIKPVLEVFQGAALDTLIPPNGSDCRAAWLGNSVIHSDKQMIHVVISRVFSCPKNPARKGLGLSACLHILLSFNRQKPLKRAVLTQALMNY